MLHLFFFSFLCDNSKKNEPMLLKVLCGQSLTKEGSDHILGKFQITFWIQRNVKVPIVNVFLMAVCLVEITPKVMNGSS